MSDDTSDICKRCNERIENVNRDNHEMYCAYVPKESEYTNLIPCEICDEFIHFSEYENHVRYCGRYSQYNPISNNMTVYQVFRK